MTVYIAGPITGTSDYVERFAQAANFLTEQGYNPANPVTLPHNHDKTWEAYMKEAISYMMSCEAVYMLKGWEGSKGSVVEHKLASRLSYKIIYQ